MDGSISVSPSDRKALLKLVQAGHPFKKTIPVGARFYLELRRSVISTGLLPDVRIDIV